MSVQVGSCASTNSLFSCAQGFTGVGSEDGSAKPSGSEEVSSVSSTLSEGVTADTAGNAQENTNITAKSSAKYFFMFMFFLLNVFLPKTKASFLIS